MKIGVITFHFVHNQGALLQCYALQKVLKTLGHEPFVIDYRPAYHVVRYSGKKNPFVMAHNNWVKQGGKRITTKLYAASRGFMRAIRMTINKDDAVNDALFNGFINSHFNLTRRYNSYRQLVNNPPEMDCYIAGSDQLWNPELCDQRLNPAYFLKFGNEDILRLTYAVSLKEKYSESEKKDLKIYCNGIDYISIREENTDLLEVTDKDIDICIDPTLLISKNEYIQIESSNKIEEPYIFVYGFETSPIMVEAVREISEYFKIKVVNGAPTRIKLDIESDNIFDYAPDQFLSLINHATYVVTNSFHGTAFSLIYHKNFTTVLHHSRGQRMRNLLEGVGLSDRIYDEEHKNYGKEIDYIKVDSKLNALRKHSVDFLQHVTSLNKREE